MKSESSELGRRRIKEIKIIGGGRKLKRVSGAAEKGFLDARLHFTKV